MYPLRGLFLATLLLQLLLFSDLSVCKDAQAPLGVDIIEPQNQAQPRRVAVIGAGSGGSSAAYYLKKYSATFSVPVNITVFERSDHVGGRSTTVNVFDDSANPIEVGASIFVKANRNLVKAAKQFNLRVRDSGRERPKEAHHSLGIWDGMEFVYLQREGGFYWWQVFKLLWRYGWSPVRTQNLVKSTVGKFLKMYRWPYFPFKSLSAATMSSGLIEATWATGEEFLKANGISDEFSREIIQASTRVNYGQNLPLIHGLETMVSMAADGAMSVEGGNWQIFRGMLDSSGANVNLNTHVNNIIRSADNRTYTLTYQRDGEPRSAQNETFDEVVVASPFQYSDIEVSPRHDYLPDTIPYVKLYVTLFATPYKLSPRYFGMPPGTPAPETILTTVPKSIYLGARREGVGPAGFWSISTLKKVSPPLNFRGASGPHYVYKVFSPTPLKASFLSDILGIEHVELYSNATSKASGARTIADISKTHISWHHEKVWNSYPYLYPRVTFEDVKLGPGLWYTSGIESFISTMETSSLSGMNVAALIMSEWVEEFEVKMKKFDDA